MSDAERPEFLLDNADVLFAVIGQLDQRVVADLRRFLNSTENLRAQIVACVYPASSTQENTLTELLQFMKQVDARLEVNLLPIASDAEASPITTVACVNRANSQHRLWFENSNRFDSSSPIHGHFGMHVDVDDAAFGRWLTRFVVLREAAAPLTSLTARVPHLVPARGTSEAAEAWQSYIQSCREFGGNGFPCSVTGDGIPEGERLTAAVERVCQEVKIDPPDQIAPVVASILNKGQIVTIDKSSRTPPLELPVKAEWLGVESFRSVGLLSRETKYRLRVFDEKTHKDLNNRRNGVTALLKRLSFPIAENLHWMPHAAKPFLHKERRRLEDEAQAMVRGLIGKDTSTFARQRRQAIERDANEFYQEFHPNESITAETLSKIVAGIEERINAAVSGDYLPKVTYASITFAPGGDSAHVSNWAQARTLLVAIAKYPREAITDSYFFRGYRIPQEEISRAMNVADDWLLREVSNPRGRAIAHNQLTIIASIDTDDKMSDREKCEKLLAIIKSPPTEEEPNCQSNLFTSEALL